MHGNIVGTMLNDKTILITGTIGPFGRHFLEHVLDCYRLKKVIIYFREEIYTESILTGLDGKVTSDTQQSWWLNSTGRDLDEAYGEVFLSSKLSDNSQKYSYEICKQCIVACGGETE